MKTGDAIARTRDPSASAVPISWVMWRNLRIPQERPRIFRQWRQFHRDRCACKGAHAGYCGAPFLSPAV